MIRQKTCLSLALGMALLGRQSAQAKEAFASSEIEGPGAEIIFCDLDGDHLKDAVLVDGLNLSIFYQDSKKGFTRKPQKQYKLENRPSLVWPVRFGERAESLLVMTSQGITELDFPNRTGAPVLQQVIQQRTIVPDVLEEPQAMFFPLSAETRTGWPLLIVPVADGLQVWQHQDAWRQVQFINHALATQIQVSGTNTGYTQTFGLNLSLGDVNGDGRDDLMLMRNLAGGRQVFNLYLQNTNGLFAAEPSLVYTNQADPSTTLCWVDLNRDGKLDLIKSMFQHEPFFVPGMRSGKVVVGTYLANEQGVISTEPQQIFRKNDWASSLPMVDVDGDGFVDLVLGYIPLSGREGLRKAITAEQVDLSLKFHFYRPGAGFPKEPDFQRDTVIHFHHEFSFTAEHRLYYEEFINLNGDFNGDGKKDLLVRDHGNEISVYFFVSREKGFSEKADLTFRCPEPIDWWEVKDLNGDGVSDLIVKLQNQNVFRIFTSPTP